MGRLMIRCPVTGREISVGLEMDDSYSCEHGILFPLLLRVLSDRARMVRQRMHGCASRHRTGDAPRRGMTTTHEPDTEPPSRLPVETLLLHASPRAAAQAAAVEHCVALPPRSKLGHDRHRGTRSERTWAAIGSYTTNSRPCRDDWNTPRRCHRYWPGDDRNGLHLVAIVLQLGHATPIPISRFRPGKRRRQVVGLSAVRIDWCNPVRRCRS